jgi:hypothetical protein
MPYPSSSAHIRLTIRQFRLTATEDIHPLPRQGLPYVLFYDNWFDLERPATPSDASGEKHSKASSRLGRIVTEDRALSHSRSPRAALDEEGRSLRRSASLSVSANVGQRALVREVSMLCSLRAPTPKGKPAMKAKAPPLR